MNAPTTPPALVPARLYGPDGARWVLAVVQVPQGTGVVLYKGRYYARKWDDYYDVGPLFEVVEDKQSP